MSEGLTFSVHEARKAVLEEVGAMTHVEAREAFAVSMGILNTSDMAFLRQSSVFDQNDNDALFRAKALAQKLARGGEFRQE